MHNITQRIADFNKTALPQMLPLKYMAIALNPFSFYRGTCHIFYEDLYKNGSLPASPITWICGDLHLENYGSYKGDNRLVYFDVNDFDESVLAPANYEIARVVCSVLVAFGVLDLPQTEAKAMAQLFLNSYAETLADGKTIYMEPRTAKGILQAFLETQAGRKKNELLKKHTYYKKNKLKIVLDDRHFAIDEQLKEALREHLKNWLANNPIAPHCYKVNDVAFRLAGTGSIGVKRYVFLLKHKDHKQDYLLIDMKQAKPSSVGPYIDIEQPTWVTEAERVLTVQHRMQTVSAAHLSSTIFNDEPYVIKEMQPIEDKMDFNLIKSSKHDIGRVVADMAILIASAQLRSSGRQGSAIADDLIAFGKDTSWHNGLLEYALGYAKKVKQDYANFLRDYDGGLIGSTKL